jgi:enoyl-CoA hydratase / long-chain 3-hydroxyacyl-CoA dehydrogenase
MEVGAKQGKTPLLVKDVAGFFVNRCLSPFLVEVTGLIHEGVSFDDIDKALKKFGMPVGPITLADEIGVDITNHVAVFMSKADLGVRMSGGDPQVMIKLVEQGMVGRKAGKGFYLYPKDAKKGAAKQANPEAVKLVNELRGTSAPTKMSDEDIAFRCISRFVNEAAFSLQDGIVRSPADGDIGAVFGIGFPPFKGGPFRMLDNEGTKQFVDKMLRLRDAKGEQFEPAQILKDYAASGKKFHK